MDAGAAFGILIMALGVSIFFVWLFYLWGAAIAEGKGRSRSLGWWPAFFGLPAILVLALLPKMDILEAYIPHHRKQASNVAEQIERLVTLRDKGALTNDEFEAKKRSLLEQN